MSQPFAFSLRLSLALVLLLSALATPAQPVAPRAGSRLKDLAGIEGVRENQLLGYGIVVGLAGTGDRRQTVFSTQSLANLLERMGVAVPPASIRINNTASVMVTATLPPFAQPGTRIDLTAASIGDASNLQGGLLLLTPLRAADGQVYAVAQGPVVTGGFVAGRGGTSQTVNHPTVGRVANGALIERPAPSVVSTGMLRLQLRRADFTTAARIAEAVNQAFASDGAAVATAENSAIVAVRPPGAFKTRQVDFIAALEAIVIESDRTAKVIVNERTGTIVMGKDVRIAPVSILHGSLSVQIETRFAVSQPAPLSSGGQTTVVPQVGVGVKDDRARNVTLQEGATVEDLVRALMSIGSTPRDIIAILQSLKSAGVLDAELEII